MGSKRPCDSEDHMRIPFKHARPGDSDEKLISFSASRVNARQKDDVLGCYYGSLCIPQPAEELKVTSADNIPFTSEKDIESSAILSTVTGNLCEDVSSYESDLRTAPFFYDHYPRKLVPIGRGHQADIPEWGPHIVTDSEQSDKLTSALIDMRTSYQDSVVRKSVGTCVIPMPDFETVDHFNVKPVYRGSDCSCLDIGSVRCVRGHVEEARESLLNSLGRDIYVDLGFLEMGEEVAHGWSVEEQLFFREVVYINPMSLGKNFWLCLSEKLPSRTRRELVSYYYNVFMLRIRAAQNRSRELEMDSDDDEWHGETSYSPVVHDEEGEDSQLESALDQDNENYSDDDDHSKGFARNAFESSEVLEVDSQFLHKDMNFTRGYQCTNRDSSGCGEIFYASGNTCASYMSNPYYSSESGFMSKHSEVTSTSCFHTEGSVSGIGLGPGLLYDSHESLMWGGHAFTSGLDLLPTSNMIEEIFGPGSCDKKSTHDDIFS